VVSGETVVGVLHTADLARSLTALIRGLAVFRMRDR
jgi:hypothetical protein